MYHYFHFTSEKTEASGSLKNTWQNWDLNPSSAMIQSLCFSHPAAWSVLGHYNMKKKILEQPNL